MANKIVVDGVTYYQEHPDLAKAKVLVEKWGWLTDFIISTNEQAQELYDNMKEEGLQFSTIEAEGFLRAAKTMTNKVTEIQAYYGDS